MAATRQHFREELARLEGQALEGLDMVNSALERVTEALEQHDVELAGFVVADDDRIDGRYLEVHQGLLSLMALQAPVAGDLRVVAALIHVIKHIERMGDQCVNIAKLVPLDGFEPPEDERILADVRRMSELIKAMIVQARMAFAQRDTKLAEDLVRRDDEVDLLNRRIFRRALDIGDEPDVREWAMHMTFVARGLERIGDNAVDVGEQAAFVATGLFREFADASHAVPRA
jgi:phosphate transport system protein